MKPYNHLPNFLERYTLLKIGKLHVRLHHITSADGTPFLHTHPFNYISIILNGEYTEQLIDKNERVFEKKNTTGNIIIRKGETFHRISECKNAKTLFIAWNKPNGWELKKHKNITAPQTYKTPDTPGIYLRTIDNKKYYSKFDNFWFIGKERVEDAEKETKPSIHQIGEWCELS
jgi:hypothetical protein